MSALRIRLALSFCSIFGLCLGIYGCEAADGGKTALPRYRLEVGQELVYRGKKTFVYSDTNRVDRISWRIWVVRRNPDESWRLLVHNTTTITWETPGQAEEAPPQEDFAFAWCDFHPDGRIVDNDSLGFAMALPQLLARLPADEQQAGGGWIMTDERQDETYRYRMLPDAEPGLATIEFIRESAMNPIYGTESLDVLHFDNRRGVPQKIESQKKQTLGGFNGGGTVELAEIKAHPAEWCRKFGGEAERYFAARLAFEKTSTRNDLSVEEFQKALTAVAADLKNVSDAVETPELKTLVAQDAIGRERLIEYRIEMAGRHAAVVDMPAVEWTTTDLSGKSHALKDYRGQVVVLDFWYRGCGWCIRAIPQVKQIAAHFESRPVVVFGMNTDEKVEDAQIVIDKIGLTYATLRAEELPEKYAVRSFPTLLILDQSGIVRDVHVGYSPTLKDEVIESIERLLTAKP